MKWVFNDGGRSRYFKGETYDCVVRAIAIATGEDYKLVYQDLHIMAKKSPRHGVNKGVYKHYLESILGYTWVPCMKIGSGCRVHLNSEELPKGTIIVQVSKHIACVIDGVLHDTYDSSREGTRCVYGYWRKFPCIGCGREDVSKEDNLCSSCEVHLAMKYSGLV